MSVDAAEQRLERNTAVDETDDGAVLGLGIVDLVGEQQTAGAGDVAGTTVGWPGMYSAMCRAMSRAQRSSEPPTP